MMAHGGLKLGSQHIRMAAIFAAIHLTFSTPITRASDKEFNCAEQEVQINIGRDAFYSRNLSHDNRVSCANCHNPLNFYGDNLPRAQARSLTFLRNTPTLLNIALYRRFFWDARADSLQAQIHEPLFAPLEIGSSTTLIQNFIDGYNLPSTNMAKESATTILISSIKKFLLCEVTTKKTIAENKTLRGKLANSAKEGERIFNQSKCVNCHRPPTYTDNKVHDIGLERIPLVEQITETSGITTRSYVPDAGAGNSKSGQDNYYAFRTPSLINIAITPPYMHDGRFNSLDEAILNHGSTDKAKLSKKDMTKIKVYLNSLTDERYLNKITWP